MRKVILFLLFIINQLASAQSECFKNCRGQSNACWEKLKARGITSTDSALNCDHVILQNLKGCKFPETELNKFEGGKFNISDLRNNVIFVHFWFTTCATCIAEMPVITKLSDEFKNDSVKFLAISFNDPKTLETFFQKKGRFGSIHTFLDQKTLENEFCLLSGYPMNLILDKNGKVLDAWTEENPESDKQEDFYKKVKGLIASNLEKN
jgi:thiol-disulfide isomerase/thioredoxin